MNDIRNIFLYSFFLSFFLSLFLSFFLSFLLSFFLPFFLFHLLSFLSLSWCLSDFFSFYPLFCSRRFHSDRFSRGIRLCVVSPWWLTRKLLLLYFLLLLFFYRFLIMYYFFLLVSCNFFWVEIIKSVALRFSLLLV